MGEVFEKLEVVKINYTCDVCGVGNMIPSDFVLMSYPPQYQHICDHCKNEEIFGESYPKISYIPKD